MPETSGVLLQSDLPIPLRGRGKVRDIYDVGDDLLIVTTDRISAFDCVLPSAIQHKGEVLNRISLFWFNQLHDLVPNHLITSDFDRYPESLRAFRQQLIGRSVLVRNCRMFPVECVARGYLAGSGWKEYSLKGTVCGIALPAGLVESDQLAEPIFTPATKAESGHDENIPFARMEQLVGAEIAGRLRELTLEIYRRAASYALKRGIVIADTKFEFGLLDGQIVLADEVLTPDSSRFWPLEEYRPGGSPPSYDKQYVRDYLESVQWNKQPPAPVLPPEVAHRTASKYVEAYRVLTGEEL
ncbi:MAG TPA: phosphoribosylaminoimidazolesuccinocarboxamide synthase [Bryobacteraceae bacterium]|nr:phosphoribosylaminoimidazolesuccinocarboxamide synthase [Bryobacteraceae bacterium]